MILLHEFKRCFFHFIISASPQVTIAADPNQLLLGGAAAVGGGLLLNHLLGDPAGKAVGKLINKGNKNRRPNGPQNIEHHHHHYLPEPEYETEEGNYSKNGYKLIYITIIFCNTFCF